MLSSNIAKMNNIVSPRRFDIVRLNLCQLPKLTYNAKKSVGTHGVSRKRPREAEEEMVKVSFQLRKMKPDVEPLRKRLKSENMPPSDVFFIPVPPPPVTEGPRRGVKRKLEEIEPMSQVKRVEPPGKVLRLPGSYLPYWVELWRRLNIPKMFPGPPGRDVDPEYYRIPFLSHLIEKLLRICSDLNINDKRPYPMVNRPPVYRSTWCRSARYKPMGSQQHRHRRLWYHDMRKRWSNNNYTCTPVLTEWRHLINRYHWGSKPSYPLPDSVMDDLIDKFQRLSLDDGQPPVTSIPDSDPSSSPFNYFSIPPDSNQVRRKPLGPRRNRHQSRKALRGEMNSTAYASGMRW